MEEIIKYVYETDKYLETYKNTFNSTIYRLNLKLYPYARIIAKSKFGYYLKEDLGYFLRWKKAFFENHKTEKELLKLYNKKKKLEKKIKTLENFLS